MKKTLCLLLVGLMLLLCACSKVNDDSHSTSKKSQASVSDNASKTQSDAEDSSSEEKTSTSTQVTPQNPSQSSVPSTSVPSNVSGNPTPSTPTGTSQTPPTPVVTQPVINTFGNQQLSGSLPSQKNIAVQGDCIYYSLYNETDVTKCGIFEYNKTTKTQRQVSKYPGNFINVVGDYLYYRGALDYYVDNWNEPYRVEQLTYKIICVNLKDGSYKPLNVSGKGVSCYDIVMYKDYVFYSEMSSERQLCRVSLNGSNHKVLADNVSEFYITDDGTVYYITYHNSSIYSCDIDGKGKAEISNSEKSISCFTGCGDSLYFATYEKNSAGTFMYNVHKISKNSDDITLVVSDRQLQSYTVISNRVLINKSDKVLNSVSIVSGEVKKIVDLVDNYTVYNNKLYVKNSQGLFEYNLDGTGKVKL